MDESQKQQAKRFDREANGLGGQLGSGAEHSDQQCVEFCPICRTADVLRASLPPEFHDHWQSLQREAVLAMRAALDHYITHLDDQRRREPPVEDIPIG